MRAWLLRHGLGVRLAIWALVGCFLLALALATAALLWNMRQTQRVESEAQLQHFITGSGEAVNRALLGVDVLLASTDELLGLSASASLWIDPPAASALLRSATRQNLMVRFVALVDARGRVLASSDPAGERLALELPPGFLTRVLAHPMSSLAVSDPALSFASSEPVLYFARSFQAGDGTQVMALAQLPVAALTPVLTQSVDIARLEVTFEREDGGLLASVPAASAGVQPVGPLVPGVRWGQHARLSQASALVAAQPTLYPQLWVSASLPEQAALADLAWPQRVVLLAALAFAAMLLAAGALVQAYTERLHAARRAVAQAKAVLDQALESMVSGFMLLDAKRRVVQWNQRFEEIFPWLRATVRQGMPFAQVLQTTVRAHLPETSAQAQEAWVRERLRAQAQAGGAVIEQRLPTGRDIQIIERPTPDAGLVITYHDVTELRRASAEIQALAFYDPLTGLPNRRLLLDRLGQAVVQAQRTHRLGALLFLDLDHFKVLNDTRGHEVGDLLLQQVAQRLSGAVRGSDTVARLGGDEFVVMLADVSGDADDAALQVQRMSEKFIAQLGQPYQLAGHDHRCTASIGAALFGQELLGAAELLKRADIAMYQIKAQRGNAVCFFDPQMQQQINARARLEGELRQALVRSEFTLYYQPQFTRAGALVGAEALLRWNHPERGLVLPGEFIALAEDSGLIVPIGAQVLRIACAQLAAWQQEAACASLQLSVNVSARQFRQDDFAAQVLASVDAAGARAERLKLELTESLLLEDVQDAIAKMHGLRARGVRFAMDDFGTGYSSLAYLTRLPLDQLKIDQSFVRNLGTSAAADVIVQTIIGMGRTLELEVIAEGVETQAQRDFLAQHGCMLYQGYLLGRPMTAQQLQVLAAHHAGANRPPSGASAGAAGQLLRSDRR